MIRLRKFIFIFAAFFASAVAALAEIIPAARLANWTPGTHTGVDGGIAQYFDGASGGNARPTSGLQNVLDYGADPTGATSNNSAFTAAKDASSEGGGIYIPVGVFRLDLTWSAGYLKNRTIRGAGSSVYSSTSNSIAGSGTKTFTIATPGVHPWQSGDTVRVRDRKLPNNYMQGTVTSYSGGGSGTGGTLIISVTSSNGSGTFNDWHVSITLIDSRDTTAGIYMGGGADFLWIGGSTYGAFMNLGTKDIAGSPAKGDTSFVVSDASGLSDGMLVAYYIKNLQTVEAFENGEATVMAFDSTGAFTAEYQRRAVSYMPDVTGTTVTLDVGLPFDLPSTLDPLLYGTTQFAFKSGIESLDVVGISSSTQLLRFEQTVQCWVYDVKTSYSTNYGLFLSGSYKNTVQKWEFWDRSADGASGSGLLMNNCCNNLVIDCLVWDNFPGFEINNGSSNNAFIGNFMTYPSGNPASLCTNHGPHNSFNYYSANIGPYVQSDGLFGSQTEDTIYRNWWSGEVYGFGFIVMNRGSWLNNLVGNVLGWPSVANGIFSYGNPNRGNDANSGLTFQPVVDGSFWLQWKGGGTLTATVTSQTARTAVLTDHTVSAMQVPNILIGTSGEFHMLWNTWDSLLKNTGVPSSLSGTTVTMPGGHASIAATSVTRSGSVATITSATDHNLVPSEWPLRVTAVQVAGADQSEYNGQTYVTGAGIGSIVVFSGGSGYVSPPTVVFTGGGGSGAAGTAVMSGDAVASVTITSQGTGYTSAVFQPTVSVSFTGGGGSGAGAYASFSGSRNFSYSVSGTPTTPATGTITFNDFPAAGTTVVFYPTNGGLQEIDAQTQATAIQKGNTTVTGASYTYENNLGGDTLADDLAYSSRPSWWRSSITWPAVNPVSPTFSNTIIPAGYRYVNGIDAPDTPAVTQNVTVAGLATVTGNVTVP